MTDSFYVPGLFLEIRGPLILYWLGFRYRGHQKFSIYLKVRFHLLTKGKAHQVNWTFSVNEAFWFENRRWANRGLPHFHCLFSQHIVTGLLRATRFWFWCKGLVKFSGPAVNQTVLK